MIKQRNNHARSKRKRKLLRLKNFFYKVFTTRARKKMKAYEPKGETIRGIRAKEVATYVNRKTGHYFDHRHELRLNQRQKRKRYRQANHCR